MGTCLCILLVLHPEASKQDVMYLSIPLPSPDPDFAGSSTMAHYVLS
jgi:hypothetical protein